MVESVILVVAVATAFGALRVASPFALRRRRNAWRGALANHLRDTAAVRNRRFAWWTVDTCDSWAPRPPKAVLVEIEGKDDDACGLRRGGTRRVAAHPAHMLEVTERILTLAVEKGCRLLTLGPVLKEAGHGAR